MSRVEDIPLSKWADANFLHQHKDMLTKVERLDDGSWDLKRGHYYVTSFHRCYKFIKYGKEDRTLHSATGNPYPEEVAEFFEIEQDDNGNLNIKNRSHISRQFLEQDHIQIYDLKRNVSDATKSRIQSIDQRRVNENIRLLSRVPYGSQVLRNDDLLREIRKCIPTIFMNPKGETIKSTCAKDEYRDEPPSRNRSRSRSRGGGKRTKKNTSWKRKTLKQKR